MQKQKKILFLHGFYASGSCVPALALKEAFEKRGLPISHSTLPMPSGSSATFVTRRSRISLSATAAVRSMRR